MQTLRLSGIPFFAGLSPDLVQKLEQAAGFQVYPAYTTVCRKGDVGKYFYAIASGGVNVSLAGGSRASTVFMGPGQVFGEMSLLADLPVSASVQTVSETGVFLISRDVFDALLDSEPEFHRTLVDMLVSRLRHRSEALSAAHRAICCFFTFSRETPAIRALQTHLFSRIRYYSPGSVSLEIAGRECTGEALGVADWPDPEACRLAAADRSLRFFPAEDPAAVGRVEAPAGWIRKSLQRWRNNAAIDQVLFLPVPLSCFSEIRPELLPADAVIAAGDPEDLAGCLMEYRNLAQHTSMTTVSVSGRAEKFARCRDLPWGFVVDQQELLQGQAVQQDKRSEMPAIDGIARWATRRQTGLCLSSGAARGFAHLGVLDVLEQNRIPVDTIAGTSMGGIVSLVYAMTGSAKDAIQEIRSNLGSNRKVRDLAIPPRGSLYAGKKVRATAEVFFGDTWINQMQKRCAVVAADLVHGERVVLDSGSAVEAALATSAIPGLFPLLEMGERLLSDGALLSRIPLDVLAGQRCGARIAVNVVPSPESRKQDAGNTFRWLKQRSAGILGLRYVIGFSWELQAWNHGINEAEQADVLISPDTRLYAGYNFDSFDEMVDAGRMAAEQQLSLIQGAFETTVAPGIP